MIDVKKLVTGFLILATIAVGSGLALSLVTNHPSTASAPAASNFAVSGLSGASSQVPTTAFVDTGSLQGNAAELLTYIDTTSTAAQESDPKNLTNAFANSLVNGLTLANPDGITTNPDGTTNINPPDTQALAQDLSASPAMKDVTIPNWDLEAQAQLIKTTPSASHSDIAQYGNSLSSVFNKYFVSSGIQSQVSSAESGDPAQLPFIASEIQGALKETLAVPTPAPLATLQANFVRVMVYEKNLVLLANTTSQDPVKTALVFEKEKARYNAAVLNLQKQISNASSLGLSFNDAPSVSVPLVARIFGVQPAHAQWVVFDAISFGQMILEYVNKIVLQILKNTLTALLQKKVLTAIQGAGVPKFVTSFAAEMVNSYQVAAISTINSELVQLPPSQRTALQMLTAIPYQAPNAATILGTIAPNTTVDPSGRFTTMGDYLSLFNSGGNTWANAMAMHDSAIIAAEKTQAAKQTQTVAQQAWQGSQTCPGGADPNSGTHLVCPAGATPSDNPNLCVDASGVYVAPSQVIPNGGQCPATGQTAAQEPKTILPGQMTGQQSNTALKTGQENITSATDIVGLVIALAQSLISQLADNAINLANSAVNGVINTQSPSNTGVTGLSSSTLNNTGNTSPATQTAVQCLPSIQAIAISTSTNLAVVNISATGGAIDTQCVTNNNCPATINSDGTPIYTWSAPGSNEGAGGVQLTGQNQTLSYTTAGSYSASVTASTDGTQSTCQITVQ